MANTVGDWTLPELLGRICIKYKEYTKGKGDYQVGQMYSVPRDR